MFAGLREQLDPSIMVVATIMIVISVFLVALGFVLRHRAARRR
jgi:ABC-type spermidine/putrescine transport system permease subunit II